MLYIWDIETIIEQTKNENQLDIHSEANNQLSSPMSFNVSTNTLTFNYLEVNGYISKMKIKESDENLVKIMIYHELGYYLTFKKHKHDLRTLMYGEDEEVEALKNEIETNAWEYGRTLAPEELLDSYDKVRELDARLLKGL
ncbi:hypothetical protein GCM10007216_31170 [Thalassobacillus devorans]|uniref:Uncharacterized protein n=2 Tax=Thalassobacillus devorans TaxID=279813 RepID=A0ABQ1PJG1_9BACI|nr:hypothetical protein [Thalassobacillus devorans]NIK30076.1 hypothetical protein [Thalassobacillus devorans]GGC98163.1 hypothetical protein GCM10007216_31170 [Thalassobacillus devorans]